ncbi:hypothetical protein AVEN_113379-1 [Araneus ventricosus]|uniref:Neurotransmitter-gated ion-channel transmembrane domain-containing protein n=1 Tax=Araneus ventricosus TaxID=182803 RepID=A0A4Y2I9K5_ARAVE|nr:hypothetical protein AVEN_113379-1 [Araneus ventricosus]
MKSPVVLWLERLPFISMNAVSIPGSEELKVLSPSCIEIVQGSTRMPNGTKVARSPSLRRLSESLERQALMIDKFSRIVFPLLFVILNVAYWSYYLR